MLPHQHHSEISNDQHTKIHQEASDAIDFIQLFLHTDMGDGHLEHFDTSVDVSLDLHIIPLLIPVPFIEFQDAEEHFGDIISANFLAFSGDPWYPKDQYLSTSTLRGPPFIS